MSEEPKLDDFAGNAADTALEEIFGSGLEHEVAAIGGFCATMLLQVAKGQIALAQALEETLPGFRTAFQESVERPETLVKAAHMLGSVIEDCVDEETPEDSMLHQVMDHLASLTQPTSK